jgi:drug/metabolite transporter (DMT)-like permease
MSVPTFLLIFVSVSFNALAQIVLRKAMLTLGPIPSVSEPLSLILAFLGNLYLWCGVGCYVISLGLWLAVLSSNQVSVAYPMLSIGYLIAAALGFFYLGETINFARLAGIALICAGVFLVARTA